MTHEEIEALLAAYALDALEPDESAQVDAHLLTCPKCRADLAAYTSVTGLLGNFGTSAPADLWERIAHEIAEEETGPDLAELPRLNSVMKTSAERHIRFRRYAIGITTAAAVVALVVALMSLRIGSLDNKIGHLQASVANTAATGLQAAKADPSTTTVSFLSSSSNDHPAAWLYVRPNGVAYFVTGALKPLSAKQTYQLWTLVNGRVVSLGLLGGHPRVVPMHIDANLGTFMLSVEPVGGTTKPTTPVVATGAI